LILKLLNFKTMKNHSKKLRGLSTIWKNKRF
jgi:hypothetical protein